MLRLTAFDLLVLLLSAIGLGGGLVGIPGEMGFSRYGGMAILSAIGLALGLFAVYRRNRT